VCGISAEGSKVIDPSVVHREARRDRNVVEVDPQLGVVTSSGPRKVVGKLKPLFDFLDVGVGFAPNKSIAQQVHSRRRTTWRTRVKVGSSSARVLETEFIYPVVADGPTVFDDARKVTVRIL